MYILILSAKKTSRFMRGSEIIFESCLLKDCVSFINSCIDCKALRIVLEDFLFKYELFKLNTNIWSKYSYLRKIKKRLSNSETVWGIKNNDKNYVLITTELDEEFVCLKYLEKPILWIQSAAHLKAYNFLEQLPSNEWSFIFLKNNHLVVMHDGLPVLERFVNTDNFTDFIQETKEYLYRFGLGQDVAIEYMKESEHEKSCAKEENLGKNFDSFKELIYNKSTYHKVISLRAPFENKIKTIFYFFNQVLGGINLILIVTMACLLSGILFYKSDNEQREKRAFFSDFEKIYRTHIIIKDNFWNQFFLIISKFEEKFSNRGLINSIALEENRIQFDLGPGAKSSFYFNLFNQKKTKIKKSNIYIYAKGDEKNLQIIFEL